MNAPNLRERSEEKRAESGVTDLRWWLIGAVALVALALGIAGGWIAASDPEPTAVVAGGGDLTDRQDQMMAMLDDFTQAWHDGDPAEVAAFFTPTGKGNYLGAEYPISDGSLARFVESGSWESLDILEPNLVDGHKVVSYHRFRGMPYMNAIEFTASGELMIVDHTITS